MANFCDWHHLHRQRLILIAALSVITALPAALHAQQVLPPNAPPMQAAPAVYTQEQIDQMVAPIALYPDPLVAQILMASTYPLEVVEADRWLQQPGNTSLKGDQLAAALQQLPWDPSVKSLVPFPQIVKMMDSNLQWTEQLGDAFLANQPGVMDSVQHLRQQAQAAGNLQSTPQQTVAAQDGQIVIQPANPQTVYVPYYNPAVAYGAWPYPDYPPYYFPPPPGYVYYDEGIFGFGLGVAILAPFWGWEAWDWHHHHIDIDGARFSLINHGRAPIAAGVWEHNPAHRHGVPYYSAPVRARFQQASENARRSYRGYSTVSSPMYPHTAASAIQRPEARSVETFTHESGGRPVRPNPVIPMQERAPAPSVQSFARAPAAVPAASRPTVSAPVMQRQAPPVYESFSRGSDVRAQAARGAYSRLPAAAPQAGGGRSTGGNHGRGANERHGG